MPINGSTPTHDPGPAPGGAALHRVECYRVETTEPVFVRMLSPDYKGLFTHYYRGRSQYCAGEACRVANHGQDRVWKGYVAAERLLVAKKPVWIPICLEITEYLELDLRGVFARGQLWELWKLDNGAGKKAPVTGKLHPDEPPPDLRRPFDIVPCLKALYHRDEIRLVHGSPLPDRVHVEELPAELPLSLRPKEKAPIADWDLEEAKKRLAKAAAEGRKSPTDEKAKRPYQV